MTLERNDWAFGTQPWTLDPRLQERMWYYGRSPNPGDLSEWVEL